MRELRLQRRIAPHQRVIVRVGNLRRVVGVIEPVVPRDLARQPLQLGGGFGFGRVSRLPRDSRRSAIASRSLASMPAIASTRPNALLRRAAAASSCSRSSADVARLCSRMPAVAMRPGSRNSPARPPRSHRSQNRHAASLERRALERGIRSHRAMKTSTLRRATKSARAWTPRPARARLLQPIELEVVENGFGIARLSPLRASRSSRIRAS